MQAFARLLSFPDSPSLHSFVHSNSSGSPILKEREFYRSEGRLKEEERKKERRRERKWNIIVVIIIVVIPFHRLKLGNRINTNPERER